MSNQDDFFTPEEVDRQIDDVSQHQKGERADAEGLAYLRRFYGMEDQQEREMLDRIWSRIANAVPPSTVQIPPQITQKLKKGKVIHMQNQPTLLSNRAIHKQGPKLLQRLGVLAATILLVALVGSMALLFNALRQNTGGTGTGGPKPPVLSTATSLTPTPKPGPVQVTSSDMSVTPESIAGIPCGTNVTVTYKATIHVAASSPGGTVQFGYTVNNGRSQTPASVTFAPGQLSKTYAFTWSGALPADHTFPEPGGINVSSPNALLSPLLGPTGACAAKTAFAVTRITMAVNPASIQGLACGTHIVVTYTATIYVAANSPGGTVQFSYTVNNGRSQTPASVTFAPGQLSKTYAFTWSGALPADHTFPEPGGINVSSPNALLSPLLGPTGTCV